MVLLSSEELMNTPLLTSVQHSLVKHLVKLRTDSAYRKEKQTLLLEGLKPILELAPHVIRVLYTSDYASHIAPLPGEKIQVSEAIIRKVSGMNSPEGIVAEIAMPPFVSLGKSKRVLALDGISDPGNMGTLLRTALAFGWEAVYFLPGGCDPFNEKVLRSARGAHFKLILATGEISELKQWVVAENVQPLVADIEGVSPEKIKIAPRCLLVLGNEAHGASPELREFCQHITIPMPGKMESLNAAVAGGILLYLFSEKGNYSVGS
jgi:TrmH family RNA methyltransferase